MTTAEAKTDKCDKLTMKIHQHQVGTAGFLFMVTPNQMKLARGYN